MNKLSLALDLSVNAFDFLLPLPQVAPAAHAYGEPHLLSARWAQGLCGGLIEHMFTVWAAEAGHKSAIRVLKFKGVEIDTAIIAVARFACDILRVAYAASSRAHNVEQGILLAVYPCFNQVECLARSFALLPQFVA